MMNDSQFVTVKTYVSRPEAEVGASLLRANNIRCEVTADDLGGTFPYPLSPKPSVELKVPVGDLDRASKLL